MELHGLLWALVVGYKPSRVAETHVLLPLSTEFNATLPVCRMLHLVRHAEGIHNVAEATYMGLRDIDHHPLSLRVSGTTFWDAPLTALGKRQVRCFAPLRCTTSSHHSLTRLLLHFTAGPRAAALDPGGG